MKKILLIILATIGLIIVGGLIWLATLDGQYDVKKSITINAPTSNVFDTVVNFNTWEIWSPWLCVEPSANVLITHSGTQQGDTYTWEGKLVGSGEIEHKSITLNQNIEQEIRFKVPFESQSNVYWQFEDHGTSTTVTWGMKGEMPFLFRFMTQQMVSFIGMDYERGLKMLKDYVEKGDIASKVEIDGIVDFKSVSFVAKKVSCPVEDIGSSMKETFKELNTFCTTDNIEKETAFTIYHTFDFTQPTCIYSTGVVVKPDFKTTNQAFYTGQIEASKAIKITFWGDYEHLGNAWSAGYMYLQHNKLKQNTKMSPMEWYITNPEQETDTALWKTEIYIPIK